MNKELLRNISEVIFNFSGLQVLESQYSSLDLFLQKKAAESNTTFEIFCENFCKNLKKEQTNLLNSTESSNDFCVPNILSDKNKTEPENCKKILSDIINFITVNETYFFREEKQFDFLKNIIFPKYMGKKINIWSAACATGEEPLSLLVLAENCNLDVNVYATDIDKSVLQKFKEGKYTSNSFRKDGSKYHNLLQPFFTQDDFFYYFHKNIIDKIQISQYNLISEKRPFPNFSEKMDIIFIRNVFIYFDIETRKKVLNFLSSQLKDDGILLFSISEVASIDNYIIPDKMEKVDYQDVYYFRHKNRNNAVLGNNVMPVRKEKSIKPISGAKEYLQKIKENKKNAMSEKSDTKKHIKIKTTETEKSVFDSKKENSNSLSVEQIFADICDYINKRDFEAAKKHVLKIKSDKKTYQFYMQAYIAYQNDEKTEAEKLFTVAEMMGKDFWPAYFYHGLVLKDVGNEEKAAVCFKKCREILDKKSNSSEYNFLIDSFSPSYIYSLCYKFQKE